MRQAIRLVMRLTEHDGFKDIVERRTQPTDSDLSSDDALDDWMLRQGATGHHISCTCKMGPASDPTAVVDQHGRVQGVEGLRVVDASIMPDCVRANINATVMMMGERVADFMKKEL
jgi:choline dehydrogenase-like flavoprotein